MTIAAVVVRWKGGEEVARCLRSLEADSSGTLSESVLVDAGSGDGGADRLALMFPGVRVAALPHNPGFAGAANHGVKQTDAEFILLLNPDTEVQDKALPALLAHLGKHPDLAGAVPLLENDDGSSQHTWQLKNLPTRRDLSLGRAGRPAFSGRPDHPVLVSQPAAAAWLIRRQVWSSLGGLDQTFFPAWWEDVDFCARLSSRLPDPALPWNHTFAVVPEARIRHSRGSSVSNLGDGAFLEAFYTNLLKFADRHHPNDALFIRKRLRLAMTAKGLLRPSKFRLYRDVIRKIGLKPF